jgi:hypothetical protein
MGNSVKIRPRGTMVVTVRITLQPGRDDDLIELIENTPKGALSAVIRESMRSGTNRQTSFETEWTDTPLQMGDLGMDL